MSFLARLRAALAPAPAEESLEQLEARWQWLYDHRPGTPEEEAAYRKLQQRSVPLGRAA